MIEKIVIVLLVAGLAVSAVAQPIGGENERTVDSLDEVSDCIAESTHPPAGLKLPTTCGWGLWLPRPLYLDLSAWADRGKDCDADLHEEVRKEHARCDERLSLLNIRLENHEADKSELRAIAYPSWWARLWKGSVGVLVGAGTGAAVGFGASFATGDEHLRSVGVGAGVGSASALVSVVVYELLR